MVEDELQLILQHTDWRQTFLLGYLLILSCHLLVGISRCHILWHLNSRKFYLLISSYLLSLERLAEDVLHCLHQFFATQVKLDDVSLWVNQHGMRNTTHIVQTYDVGAPSLQGRDMNPVLVGHLILVDAVHPLVLLTVDGIAEHLEVVGRCSLSQCLLHERNLTATRRTPGSPDVQEDKLALQLRQRQRLTI